METEEELLKCKSVEQLLQTISKAESKRIAEIYKEIGSILGRKREEECRQKDEKAKVDKADKIKKIKEKEGWKEFEERYIAFEQKLKAEHNKDTTFSQIIHMTIEVTGSITKGAAIIPAVDIADPTKEKASISEPIYKLSHVKHRLISSSFDPVMHEKLASIMHQPMKPWSSALNDGFITDGYESDKELVEELNWLKENYYQLTKDEGYISIGWLINLDR